MCEIIHRNFIQFQFADFDQRELVVEPHFRHIKRIPAEFLGLLLGHDLDEHGPFREVTVLNRIH
ncbi:hypothetical protein SDC9_151499 [bioreactor metagenome]|uniref:Uncharacterized protein n=1 Tax=bioreactor metagenome TaxID=1076179 RepID=A0A645EUT3_9ZZZZ